LTRTWGGGRSGTGPWRGRPDASAAQPATAHEEHRTADDRRTDKAGADRHFRAARRDGPSEATTRTPAGENRELTGRDTAGIVVAPDGQVVAAGRRTVENPSRGRRAPGPVPVPVLVAIPALVPVAVPALIAVTVAVPEPTLIPAPALVAAAVLVPEPTLIPAVPVPVPLIPAAPVTVPVPVPISLIPAAPIAVPEPTLIPAPALVAAPVLVPEPTLAAVPALVPRQAGRPEGVGCDGASAAATLDRDPNRAALVDALRIDPDSDSVLTAVGYGQRGGERHGRAGRRGHRESA
jgi:hypothetical protein